MRSAEVGPRSRYHNALVSYMSERLRLVGEVCNCSFDMSHSIATLNCLSRPRCVAFQTTRAYIRKSTW